MYLFLHLHNLHPSIYPSLSNLYINIYIYQPIYLSIYLSIYLGHAGASGYVPESTLLGYDLAANLLADYSEPDLVLTKDKYFIAMHDLTLEGTTDVESHPEFKDRVSTFVIEGKPISGYYAINFTLR